MSTLSLELEICCGEDLDALHERRDPHVPLAFGILLIKETDQVNMVARLNQAVENVFLADLHAL